MPLSLNISDFSPEMIQKSEVSFMQSRMSVIFVSHEGYKEFGNDKIAKRDEKKP